LKRIVRDLPSKRQTLFFSATMPKTIRELAGQFIKDPVEVKVTPEATTAERVEQRVTFVRRRRSRRCSRWRSRIRASSAR
jgi:ATP-dependent RNA helicase RhlE